MKKSKYRSKHDIELGKKLRVIKQKVASYGTLNADDIVTLVDITHFPTQFNVIDDNGKKWALYTHDFKEINED